MIMKPGQIISHCCRFPPKKEEEMDRHLVLSANEKWLEIYCLFTFWPEGPHRPGEIDQILVSTIESEEDTSNNFYWKILS